MKTQAMKQIKCAIWVTCSVKQLMKWQQRIAKLVQNANPSVHKDEVVMEGSYTPQAVNKVVLKINIMVRTIQNLSIQNNI
jgi:hypothetical protein